MEYTDHFRMYLDLKNMCMTNADGVSNSYTMPTRDVSRIHEAIINIPEGGARGNIDYC